MNLRGLCIKSPGQFPSELEEPGDSSSALMKAEDVSSNLLQVEAIYQLYAESYPIQQEADTRGSSSFLIFR